MAPTKSLVARLFDTFHTHPRGRLFEFLFFSAIGLAMGVFAYVGKRLDWFSEPIAWLIALIALCLVLFALLPQKKRAGPAPPPKGKRGAIAQQVKASKAEKRKGPPPPIQ